LIVSEQQAEQTPADAGSVAGEPTASTALVAQDQPAAVSHPETATIVPDREAPSVHETPRDEPVKARAPEVDIHNVDAGPHLEPANDKPLIMSAGDRVRHEPKAAPTSSSEGQGKRRLSAMAAVAALATIAGALGGVLATTGMTHVADVSAAIAPSGNPALEAAVARIDADILALKSGLEQTSKAGMAQFNKTSDRLERIEKAQAEPAAKLVKLSEAVEKLRTAPAVMTAAQTPKDVPGSVTPPPGTAPLPMPAAPAIASATPKTEVGKLPTVDGWHLADVGYGGALIQNRRGTYEVYAGDFVPGLGRIEAIRKQDGRWVVVTSKGLIAR
jgi:hypothetical protein